MAVGKSGLLPPLARAPTPALAFLARRIYIAGHLPQLRFGHFARGPLAMPLRLHVLRARAPHLPHLRNIAAHGALLRVRRDREAAQAMRVTARRLDFFRLLSRARWLTTGQVHRRFFRHATPDAARKWLRLGVASGHLVSYRAHRMSEALFALGPEGKRALERTGGAEIQVERKPPKQVEHLCGINDIRIAAELTASLSYFFACWELPGLGWKHAIIPDAVFELAGRTFAAEFDRGLEGLPIEALIIVADRRARMESLARAVAGSPLAILFTTLERVRRQTLAAPIFHRHGSEADIRLY